MKSSSELFPVALLGAEALSLWSEDTYSLKPNNSSDLSVEFVLTRVSRLGRINPKPVLWLPPLLTSRSNWRDRWEVQVTDLLEHGYEVWLLEWRGHGLSPRAQCWAQTQLQDLAAYDVPAAAAFVANHTQQPITLLAEGSAAQIWLAAHAGTHEVTPFQETLYHAPSVLLWPVLGRVGLAHFVRAVGWEDRQLEVTRQGVQTRGGFEVLPRSLFDELLFGRNERSNQWQGNAVPSRFGVVDTPGRERTLLEYLKTVPQGRGRALLSAPEPLPLGMLRRWLDLLQINPVAAEGAPPEAGGASA